ncbi:methylmalonyl-CoA epimerase [Chloroflexota bacterium]
MLSGIHHIGIAVKNLDEAVRVYNSTLGTQVESTHDASDRGIRVALLSVGNAKLELIEPAGTESAMAEFIKNHGEGIHHIAFEVDDVSKELEALSAKGIKLRDSEPRQGVTGKIAFMQPEAMNGVLIELIENKS